MKTKHVQKYWSKRNKEKKTEEETENIRIISTNKWGYGIAKGQLLRYV